jgi:N-acetylmuramoyl-L-alanine amidase
MKIYISPSTQDHNTGVSPFTTEEFVMNTISDYFITLLKADGRFDVKRNSPSMDDVYSIASDSNAWGADIHVAIHSNAGGGEGTEVFAYGANTNSERLAKALYNQIAPLSPGNDRGVKYKPGLIEVGDCVKATACLIELAFHDNLNDAKWLIQYPTIAQALYKGLCNYCIYDYRALAEKEITIAEDRDPDVYLSVRVRTSKADALVKQILGMGYACKKLDLA